MPLFMYQASYTAKSMAALLHEPQARTGTSRLLHPYPTLEAARDG